MLSLCKSMDGSAPGSSVRGFLQARILEWVAISSSMKFSPPRDRIPFSCISCIGRRILYQWAPWEVQKRGRVFLYSLLLALWPFPWEYTSHVWSFTGTSCNWVSLWSQGRNKMPGFCSWKYIWGLDSSVFVRICPKDLRRIGLWLGSLCWCIIF